METEQKYDSRADTLAHINRVNELLLICCMTLQQRAIVHDRSKLEDPEKAGFDACTLKLKSMAYGSPEYKAALEELKPFLVHHYTHNSHHPEHFVKPESDEARWLRAKVSEISHESGRLLENINRRADEMEAQINGMNLFDLIEMLMDWKAATERMAGGGDIRKSLEINTGRFHLSPQLVSILLNTIEMMWPNTPNLAARSP